MKSLTAKIVLCLLCLFCIAGCVAKPENRLPRPDRSYLNWLERQSLIGKSTELPAEVSQSGRMWLNAGGGGRADILLAAAPTWLEFDPGEPGLATPYFSALARQLPQLKAQGIRGLYLGQTGEKASIWLESDQPLPATPTASLDFDADFGDEQAFANLAQTAEQNGFQIGSTMLGASTGLGPDFFLQARNAPQSAGLYAMLPVSAQAGSNLPKAASEWEGQIVGADQIAQLAAEGIIPEKMARDDFSWTRPGGWAITGEITGQDGQNRRWLYRYENSPRQAVLLWQDPYGRAKRVLAAAVIQQTGLQGQSLTGLAMSALLGLEPAAGNADLAPGLEAINDLAAQIHRYGGWALQADPLPASIITKVLAGVCDFCREDQTWLLARAGLATHSCGPLVALYRLWVKDGLDFSRLCRGMINEPPNTRLVSNILASAAKKLDLSENAAFLPALAQLKLGLPGLAFVNGKELSEIGQEPESASQLQALLLARQQQELAKARFVVVKEFNDKVAVFVSELPKGGYWVTAINFNSGPEKIVFTLPRAAKEAQDVATGRKMTENFIANGKKFSLELDGSQCRNVIFSVN